MKTIIDAFINEISEKKAENILYVDTTDYDHPFTDAILVTTALNDIHLKSTTEALKRFYKKNKTQFNSLDFLGVSGSYQSQWVILDFNGLIIHIMTKDMRERYEFDELFKRFNIYQYH